MTFPSNPNDNDIHTVFGRRLKYKGSTSTWEVVSSPSVAIETEAPVANTAVSSSSDLPLTGNEIGAMSYSQDTNTLYVWNGTGWFKIALVNTNPTITDGGQATYELNGDGTPTVINLVANDPEGLPLTWSYSVTSGALEDTTISNAGAEFTITPGAIPATFNLTFTASDGVNIDTSTSAFTLAFADWTAATLLHTLDNPNAYGTSASDQFGYAVAVDGDYAIVGAYGEDDADGTDSGKAYIFNVTTGTLVHTLDNPNAYGGSGSDTFGQRVGMSGNYAIVSDSGDSGKVYVFDVITGALVRTLNNPNDTGNANPNAGLLFGTDIAISGERAAVAARYSGNGRVHVFNVTTGALIYTIEAVGSSIFGETNGVPKPIDISANHIIVGSWKDNSNSGTVYLYDVTNGTLLYTWVNPSMMYGGGDDRFGFSVSVSGNYAVVGAQQEEGLTGQANVGVIYVFDVTTGALIHSIHKPGAETSSAWFGTSVKIDNDVIIASAPQDRASDANTLSGNVYIIDAVTGAVLKEIENPSAYGTRYADRFGNSVSISGDYAIVGASLEDDAGGSGSGKTYIFQAG